MSSRSIAVMSATAVLLFGMGAVAASAALTVAGLSVGLVAALVISIKTDDPTRTMSEILLEDRGPSDVLVEALAEERVAA
jgi:hypothetical protein